MANFKKALAVVLAAATAFTFAPFASFSPVTAKAAADDVKTLTPKVDGIDSIDVAGWTVNPTNKDYAVTTDGSVWVKETKDANGQAEAYRIDIEKKDDGTRSNAANYVDLVDVTTGAGDVVTNTATTAEAYWAIGESNASSLSESTWVVKANKDTTSGVTDYVGLKECGGARLNFKATGAKYKNNDYITGDIKVKISALRKANDVDSVISGATGTYTIHVATNTEKFELDKTALTLKESQTYNLAYKIFNNHKIKKVTATTDNPSIVGVQTTDSTPQQSTGNTYTGTVALTGGQAGTAVVTLTARDEDNKVVDSKACAITVKAKNSKLQVSYKTADGGAIKTYTDDYSIYSTNSSVVRADSYTGDVLNNGQVTFKASLAKDNNGYLLTSDGNSWTPVIATTNDGVSSSSIYSYGSDGKVNAGHNSGWIQSTQVITNNVTSASPLIGKLYYGLTANGQDFKPQDANHPALLPDAQLLSDGSNGTKSVQISASASAGQKLTYALVAASSWKDQATNTLGSNNVVTGVSAETKTYTKYTVNNSADPLSQKNFDSKVDVNQIGLDGNTTTTTGITKVKSGVAAGDEVVLSADAAKNYGSIDQNGTVQIKNANDAPQLYVVVAASANNDQDIPASTYIIPLTMEANDQVDFFAADQTGYADIDSSYATTAYTNFSGDAANHIYLTKGGTNQLFIKSNIPNSYFSFKSSDPKKVTVSDSGLITAVDTTSASSPVYVTITSSSAPNIAGLVNVRFQVEVNAKASQGAPSLKGVTVNMSHPVDKIEATPAVAGNTVVFDGAHRYVKVSTDERPSGYKAVRSSDNHVDDLTLSTAGNVTYNKNDGVQYVRAYVAADAAGKYNPSGWTYVAVNYGQNLAKNNMTVDTTPVVVKAGESKKIAASGSSITFESADPSVATVSADGTVTGVKAGSYTTVTVKSAATSTMAEGTAQITVVVTDKNGEMPANDVKKPSKVTGVKVKNVKGGKVTVTWKKQNQKNIKYYVKKTVGKKSSGKSVNGGKTTLSVKKGATVKVKVKAYIYNASGKKLVGSYSKTVTLKTDKK